MAAKTVRKASVKAPKPAKSKAKPPTNGKVRTPADVAKADPVLFDPLTPGAVERPDSQPASDIAHQ